MTDAELVAFIREENATITIEPGFGDRVVRVAIARRGKRWLYGSATSVTLAIDRAIQEAENEGTT